MTTPIPGKRPLKLTLGGVERDYLLDLAGMTYAEQVYDGELSADIKKVMSTFGGLRAILFGGLRRCDSAFTIEQLDDLVTLDELVKLKEQLVAAAKANAPRPEDVPLVEEAVAVAPTS